VRPWSVPTPTNTEGQFVAKIFAVPQFQANIEQQKLYKGGHNADPFVIAKAATDGLTVVTMEKLKPNAAKTFASISAPLA
jgi:Domain of unknown function (DUF4411)